jgi:protein O-GlcNAc transferase
MQPNGPSTENLARAAELVQRGFSAHQGGEVTLAEDLYAQALTLNPHDFNALQLLGVIAIHRQDSQSADSWLTRALGVQPHDIGALLNHAIVLQNLKRSDEAIQRYNQVLEIRPHQAAAFNGRGIVLATLGHDERSMQDFNQAIASDPEFAEAYLNRGSLRYKCGDANAAYEDFKRASELDPADPESQYNLGLADLSLGRTVSGIHHLSRVLELQPDHQFARHHLSQAAWQLCDWTDYLARRGALLSAARAGKASLNSIQYLALTDSAEEQYKFAELCRDQSPGLTQLASQAQPLPITFDGDRRIRICYMSSDFRDHAISYLIAGLIEAHDRKRFEVIGVYFGPDTTDPMHHRMVSAFDRFERITSLPDDDAFERLRKMDIDVLLDLNGATKNARASLIARRVAPLQINFLGFPGTMWKPSYDYIVGDAYLIPPEAGALYAEQVIRLPDTFQPNDDKRAIAQTGRGRGSWNLPQHAFVFAVFHAPYKITPEMYLVWMRLLSRVERSVLWILANEPETRDNLQREASAQGIDPARIVFASNVIYAEHLERCRHADLVLDTFPFNGGTTTSDMLWAGVPTISISGEAFAARMSGSLLRTLGVGELATNSVAEYEQLAYELAVDRDALRAIRRRIEDGLLSSPLFDTRRFANNLENALIGIVNRRLQQQV